MLRRGWRRQGACFFRPRCAACHRCRSLRVRVFDFQSSKSQRRALKANADLRLVIRTPRLTDAHLRLFDDYHADMHERRGWNSNRTSASEYAQTFLMGSFSFATEFAYYQARKLVAIGLVDVTDHALSSIYFYHDPALRHRGVGTYSVLQEIEYAKQSNREHLYLGYWIPENDSMKYKNRFWPHEILVAHVNDDDQPEWISGQKE